MGYFGWIVSVIQTWFEFWTYNRRAEKAHMIAIFLPQAIWTGDKRNVVNATNMRSRIISKTSIVSQKANYAAHNQ